MLVIEIQIIETLYVIDLALNLFLTTKAAVLFAQCLRIFINFQISGLNIKKLVKGY